MTEQRKIKHLKGEYVHRIIGGRPSKKIYHVLEYCRTNKAWQLDDVDDISRSVYIKGDRLAVIAEY